MATNKRYILTETIMKLMTNIIYTVGAIVLIVYIFFKEYMPDFIMKHISVVVLVPLLLILGLEIYRRIKK